MVGLVRMGGRVSQRYAARVVCGVASFGRCLSVRMDRLHSSPNPHKISPAVFLSEPKSARPACKAVRDDEGRAVPAVLLTIRSISDGTSYESTTDAEGIFRMRDIRWACTSSRLCATDMSRW
jgi:hypothetical protein